MFCLSISAPSLGRMSSEFLIVLQLHIRSHPQSEINKRWSESKLVRAASIILIVESFIFMPLTCTREEKKKRKRKMNQAAKLSNYSIQKRLNNYNTCLLQNSQSNDRHKELTFISILQSFPLYLSHSLYQIAWTNNRSWNKLKVTNNYQLAIKFCTTTNIHKILFFVMKLLLICTT